MSRSKKGGKPIGWEYWGKRKCGFFVDRRTSHKMERMQLKENLRDEVKSSLYEMGDGETNLLDCVYWRSLFPKAKYAYCYEHYVLGETVVVVDGKFSGYIDHYNELLAFSYHYGIDYTDSEDLENKYFEFLESNDNWSFLP